MIKYGEITITSKKKDYVFYVFELIPLMEENRGFNQYPKNFKIPTTLGKSWGSLFCCFKIPQTFMYYNSHGLYCFMVGNSVKYIGKSLMKYGNRINLYGSITASKCSKTNQSTNCRINSLINKAFDEGKSVRVGFYPMDDKSDDEIKNAEKDLLDLKFDWNIQS